MSGRRWPSWTGGRGTATSAPTSHYVGDVAVGVLEPGAVTVALFFESARRGA